MPHPIEPSTLHIIKPTGETVGTGFLVSKNLAVTCAHVVKILGAGTGDMIDIRFTGKSAATTARVLPEYWRPDDATDIALLQVDEVPAGVSSLRMGRASESRLKNDLYTFGYAIAGDEQGIGGLGTFITLKQEGNFIQFRMHEANHGHSGAPIYDDQRGVVVGMIKKGHTGTGRNAETTFAIPIETIWQVCPQLKPPTPVLPRRNPIVEGINLLPYDYDQRIQNFLTEYLGTESPPVPFGGRDEALHMLDAWLAKTTPYLLLAAPAGRGKSALLVRWLDSLSAREDLALAFVPVSIRFGTNMERVFYAALAARLAFLHGDDVPASPETSTAVYRGLVSDYLSKPLANGRTLLVVLDGLDEAADWQAGADFMPGELPAGVRVVVSARFLAGDVDSTSWLRHLNWEHNGLASAPSLAPLDQEGVRDVLFKMGCPLDELSRNVDIVAELYRLSEGDPLLVGLYVSDLWAKGEEVARLISEDLAGIQPGYKGYFDRWWDDQKKLWKDKKPWLEKHVRAVRNLLARAIDPLFSDDFQALKPELDSDYIADALEVLQRFIIGDNQSQGYTFGHPKLGQYFWEALTTIEQAQVEERFLAWGEQTLQEFIAGKRDPKKKADVPVYAVRNYTTHLGHARQSIEKWLSLIHHQQWAQAWFTVEGAYGGYSQDVQRVWEQCRLLDRDAIEKTGKAPYLGSQVRCGLIETSLHSLASNIPAEFFAPLVTNKIWTFPQALVYIRKITNPRQKSDAVSWLLPYLTEEQLSEIFLVAKDIYDESSRASAFCALVEHMPNIDLDKIFLSAQEFKTKDGKANILIELANHMSETRLGDILNVARGLTGECRQPLILGNLAKRMPGLWNEVLRSAKAISNEKERAYVFKKLINDIPETMLDDILTATQDIEEEVNRAAVLEALASKMSKPKLNRILLFAKEINRENIRVDLLVSLVDHLSKQKLKDVIGDAQTIKDKKSQAYLLFRLAKHRPRLLNDAVDATKTITDTYEKTFSLIMLCKNGLDLWDDAIDSAKSIKDESRRAYAFSILAENLPETKISELLTHVMDIHDESIRARILCDVARRDFNLWNDVLNITKQINDENKRADILSVMAEHIPESFLNEVLAMGRDIKYTKHKAIVLKSLTNRIPGLWGEILTSLNGVGDVSSQSYVFSNLVEYLSDKELDELITIARETPHDISRAQLLSTMIGRVPELTHYALSVARGIEPEKDRATILEILAKSMQESELNRIVKILKEMAFRRGIANVLLVLSERMPISQLDEILDIARQIDDEGIQSEVLCSLAKRIPDIWHEAFVVAVRGINEESKSRVLTQLVKHLPEKQISNLKEIVDAVKEFKITENKSRILLSLTEYVPGLWNEALDIALTIENEKSRLNILLELPAIMPDLIIDKVLFAAGQIKNEWDRAVLLKFLADNLPDSKLEQIVTMERALRDASSQAFILLALSHRMPYLWNEALLKLDEIKNKDDKVFVTISSAKYTTERLSEAFEAAIFNENRASLLDFLVENTNSKLSNARKYELTAWSLQILANNTRSDFLTSIVSLIRFMITPSKITIADDIYQAVHDVTTWWP